MSARFIPVCRTCGGANVASDATVSDLCDGNWCDDCGDKCSIRNIDLAEGETYNRFARPWPAHRFVVAHMSHSGAPKVWTLYHYAPDTLWGDADQLGDFDSRDDALTAAGEAAGDDATAIVIVDEEDAS